MAKSLRLVSEPNGEMKPWKDPRPDLIQFFNKTYQERTGEKNPFPFGACMKAMYNHFEQADPKTGEVFIEYPEMADWERQVLGFFEDDWARDKCNFFFAYFISKYGRFAKVKMKAATTGKRCKYCGTFYTSGLCSACYPPQDAKRTGDTRAISDILKDIKIAEDPK